VAPSKRDIQRQFHAGVLQAYAAHGFRSYRHAEQITGVNYSTIYNVVSRGRIPTRGQVIELAEGLGEPINKWLELAGYDPVDGALVAGRPSDVRAAVRVAFRASPDMPEEDKEELMGIIEEWLTEHGIE